MLLLITFHHGERHPIVSTATTPIADHGSEIERQKTIAENRKLLDSLGLDDGGAARLNLAPKPKPAPATRKRKAPPVKIEAEGPRRRSGRLAGLELDDAALAVKAEEEEKKLEEIRIVNRKIREQVMAIKDIVEDTPERLIPELEAFLPTVGAATNARVYPSVSTSAKEAYADNDALPAEVQRLQSAFSNMVLTANTKVTTERVFSMVVHPEPTKTLVLVGDKNGQLGM